MSFQASVVKLPSPVKDLVLRATSNGDKLVGDSEKDQDEVSQWIDKIATGVVVQDLKALDTELVPRTYIVSNYLTGADVALYGALHPVVSQMKPAEHYAHPSVTRYFDHIQASAPVREAARPEFPFVEIDLANAPSVVRKADAPKKKEKKSASATPDTSEAVATAPKKAKAVSQEVTAEPSTSAGPTDAKTQKKEKKKKEPAPAKAPAPDDGMPVPSMIDLRVGHIIDIKKHPDADSLYVEQIDLGEETGPRTVVSGLVHYIPIEEMRDKYLVAVCNLKPANMRGVKSFAMVLCATSKDGKEGGIELIQPPPGSKSGERVYFEGADFENATPLVQLNPKKKIFETIQPGFITLDSREAAWVNLETKSIHRIRTKDGFCVAPTLVGASLS
ncbi:nucleic acid-binding protein [Fistulina hepatica ATCC 64428]|uniref:Nucleic acid-binding protein n=1 Tax=Fistulina hepatica ATCC 64428 TaxID=1128425 RepID=A0A0D7A663_9AGAR|nr:nucleic acid-binding protein [Fistulina hepatica ATCC 64428]